MALILIVDDQPSSLTLLKSFLRSGGHDVLEAADGAEALKKAQEFDLDAMITDLRMPVVNGLRLIRALRDGGDAIPIIAVSGPNRDQLILALDYGANAALPKPLDRDEVLAVIDKVMAENRSNWSDAWIHPEFGKVSER